MNTTRRKVTAALAATGLALGLAACGGGSGSDEDGPIKIGAVFPLTGPAAPNGDWAKLGTEIAVEEINADGGIDGRKVEVVYGDDELDATKSVTEMNRVINQEKVDMVLGPLASDPVLATLSVLKSSQTPSIMGAGSEKVTPELAPYSFSWTMNATTQAQEMVKAAVKAGAKSIAILNDGGTQGKTAASAMKKEIEKQGLKLAGTQEMSIQNTDVTPQLLSLKKNDPDHVLLFPVASTDTARVLEQAKQLNWDVPITGSYGTTFADTVKKIAGPNAYENTNAITFSSFSACAAGDVPSSTADFVKKVRDFSAKRAKGASFDSVAQTYDAVYLLKAAVEETGSTDGPKIAEWIEKNAGTAGKDLPTVNKTFTPSSTSHFLFGADALSLVDPGKSVSDSVFQRAGC
ncbi:MAG: ABC transporter substrate-binding protein [Aeromicrobium erythreum]